MPTVLVTGASRGIGRETALRLARAGWQIYAGVREPGDGEALKRDAPAGRIQPLILDVADDAQVAALAETLPAELDAVVNNAGIVVPGPVEALTPAGLRQQLDVNVVGQVAVTQAVLPKLRRARGRVVFMSSVSGRVSTPLLGAYAASKFAIEALGDALRLEVAPWGIHVSLIEPGAIDTEIWRSALDQANEVETSLSADHRALYARHVAGLRKTIPRIQKQTSSPEKVAAAVERALTEEKPRARYLVGPDAYVQLGIQRVLPPRARDGLFARLVGVPR
jgi:NAD(P)-dependent dehydrogenase (short-subunit alcohol dehydrogenase family)